MNVRNSLGSRLEFYEDWNIVPCENPVCLDVEVNETLLCIRLKSIKFINSLHKKSECRTKMIHG